MQGWPVAAVLALLAMGLLLIGNAVKVAMMASPIQVSD